MKLPRPLQQRWQPLAQRIDALSLRERVFLFLSVSVVIAAVFDSLVLSPLLKNQQQWRQLQQKQAADLGVMRQQLKQAVHYTQTDSPQGQLRHALQQAEAEQKAMDRALQQSVGLVDKQSPLPEVLGKLLRQHPRLTLLKLNTMEAQALSDNRAKLLPSPALSSHLQWQGVELQVTGSYLDLMAYTAELERSLPTLRWGELRLDTETGRVTLHLQLFLVESLS